jgi:DNA polymerase I
MKLLPEWEKEVARQEEKPKLEGFRLPKSPEYHARKVNYVISESQGQNMVELAFQRPLSHIGMEFLYDNNNPLGNAKSHNPHAIEPLLLSLVMAEPGKDGKKGTFYRFVIDLRKHAILPILRTLFALPVCFVGHEVKNGMFCLWKLGLEAPKLIWDTFICEETIELGRYHPKYYLNNKMELTTEIRVKEEIRERQAVQHSLQRICQRQGIPSGGRTSEGFIASLAKARKWRPLKERELEEASERALLVGRLYFHQVQQAAVKGISNHFHTVEMPYLKTNAEIEWNGVKIDRKRQARTIKKSKRYLKRLKKALDGYGLSAPPEDHELKKLFKQAGIIEDFKVNGKVSFEKAMLKKNEASHPAIPLILNLNRLTNIHHSEILQVNDFNGRIYPQYNQLGTHTGRVTSKNPSIMSLDRLLRPLIVPGKGRAIGEADWSQIEIGILAALYQDSSLIAMFNSEDVYSEMVKAFYKKKIEKADLRLPIDEFKKKYSKEHQTLKTCVLGIIYGMSPKTLGERLSCSIDEAQRLYQDVINMLSKFQTIQARVEWSGIRGYSSTATNLHRRRNKSGKLEPWEKRWLLNHPVQGTCAAIFKATANRLAQLYKPFDAKIIIPLHDSFVFEAPQENLEEVADLTERVMRQTVQEFFPELKPRVKINITSPKSWNKDGDVNSFKKWIKSLDPCLLNDHI